MKSVQVEVLGLQRAQERVAAIKAGVTDGPRRVAREIGSLVQGALQQEAPSRTGTLRGGITFRTRQEVDALTLRFAAPWYTHFVTRGTKAHEIWAGFYTGKSDKRFLFFGGGGAAHVHHPGSRADDFVRRAYDRSMGPIRDVLSVVGRSILGK